MLDRMVTTTEFLTLVDRLGVSRRIIGPVAEGNHFQYRVVDSASKVDLTFSHTLYSPKPFLFPPRETLFCFDRSNGSFVARAIYDHSPSAIVGVHPCDVHGIRLLDHVFAAKPGDRHYQHRRENTLIIGIDCPRPCTDCVFCADLKTNAADQGFDLMLYPLGESESDEPRYGVVIGSPAGKNLILENKVGLAAAADDERKLSAYLEAKRRAFPLQLSGAAENLPDLLQRSYDSLLWEATARRCYSCGSCNLVCPTCYCFDIHDETSLKLESGERVREWDGCQLHGFAEVAGGHNFRTSAAARLRHRVFRKGKWVQGQTGLPGCVGCGRCSRACTAKISLLEIYRQLAEEN